MTVTWWKKPEYRKYDAIICDGAVRSGKTLSMSIGYVLWASQSYAGQSFAICGKTVTSLRRNVITPLIGMLREMGIVCREHLSSSYVEISLLGRTNRFYLFGGKDEGSAALIQGITLAGVFLDEVALMPRSFVEQALARCSVSRSRMWFNCNPDTPQHWFYREWIQKAEEKKALYLHFTMEDNPSLSERVRERYRRLYSGTFYDRFILGRWTAAEGLVYPMFSSRDHVYRGEKEYEQYVISCDYGTVNPSSFGLWGLHGGIWHRVREYYYSSKREGMSRTDEEHYAALEELAGTAEVSRVIVDPSAASFIECIRRHGRFRAVKADNDVSRGIQLVSAALKQGKLKIHESCEDAIREFGQYKWNESAGKDVPIKENDHAMDDIRYFVTDVYGRADRGEVYAVSVAR